MDDQKSEVHRLTKVELLSALYLYLNRVRGLTINPSAGQLSQCLDDPECFELKTWIESSEPESET